MKKILAVTVLALTIMSCGSDDDNASSQGDASIVGTFVLTSFDSSSFNDDYNNDGTISSNLLVEIPCFMNTVTFNENGSYASTATTLVINFGNGENITAGCEGPFDETGTYALNGDIIMINQETTTDPDGDVTLFVNSGTIQITNTGLTVTVEDSLGTGIFQYDRQ